MRTAFITGGGRGLGRGFAENFLQQGFQVFIGVRDPAKLDQQLSAHPDLVAIKLDVTDDSSIQQAFSEVVSLTDHLDYLVNNAGLNKDTATNGNKKMVCDLASLDRQLLLKMFNVNTVAPAMMVKGFLPLLTPEPAFVINISSCRSSIKDEPGSTANYGYRASKAGLNMMTYCLTRDLPANVKIYAVHPGMVKTDMNPQGQQTPFDQAKYIIGISQNWREELNGRFLNYDGKFFEV
ncbi:MAG: SDR family NAD(P)-dependent oxidoreductase [Patescibacteria group bacterium]